MESIITQLHILDYINVYLVLFLLGIGFIFKYGAKWLPNKFIPLVLYAIGLIYELLSIEVMDRVHILNGIIDGTIAAAIAIGLHSSGKQIISFDQLTEAITNAKETIDEDTEDMSMDEDDDEEDSYEEDATDAYEEEEEDSYETDAVESSDEEVKEEKETEDEEDYDDDDEDTFDDVIDEIIEGDPPEEVLEETKN